MTVFNSFRPLGEQEQYVTGLIYFNARYYDPEIGRFLTEDPAPQGTSWYSYCGNNPVNAVDPDGRYSSQYQSPAQREFSGRDWESIEYRSDFGSAPTSPSQIFAPTPEHLKELGLNTNLNFQDLGLDFWIAGQVALKGETDFGLGTIGNSLVAPAVAAVNFTFAFVEAVTLPLALANCGKTVFDVTVRPFFFQPLEAVKEIKQLPIERTNMGKAWTEQELKGYRNCVPLELRNLKKSLNSFSEWFSNKVEVWIMARNVPGSYQETMARFAAGKAKVAAWKLENSEAMLLAGRTWGWLPTSTKAPPPDIDLLMWMSGLIRQ